MDAVSEPRRSFLAGLSGRLAAAVGAAELVEATRPPEGAGIDRRLDPDELRIDGRLFPSPIPRVSLVLHAPVDARELCTAWGIDRPVAVSGDVHQVGWELEVGGEELLDPGGRRIAAQPLATGRWEVRVRLVGRPVGALPGVVAGASPAYDLRVTSGAVRKIEITPARHRSAMVRADHPEAAELLASAAAAFPHWRTGWDVAPDADVVLVYDVDRPVVGAALGHDGAGTFQASRFWVRPGAGTGCGSALIDAVEALVLNRGGTRLRLDGSVFLHPRDLPYERHGYVVGPPYGGDTDVPVWAERDLRPTAGWEPVGFGR